MSEGAAPRHSSELGRPRVPVRLLDPAAVAPGYALAGDAGADLASVVDVILQPGERAVVPTGVAIAIPAGYAGFVHPRSGLAARAGLGMVNAPGTIDSGYRGELKVILINHDPVSPIVIKRGDRIAQLVIQRVESANFEVVEELDETARAGSGFGSTGGFSTGAARLPAADQQAVVTFASITRSTDGPGQTALSTAEGEQH